MAEQEWSHSAIIFEPLLSQALGHRNEKGPAPTHGAHFRVGRQAKEPNSKSAGYAWALGSDCPSSGFCLPPKSCVTSVP